MNRLGTRRASLVRKRRTFARSAGPLGRDCSSALSAQLGVVVSDTCRPINGLCSDYCISLRAPKGGSTPFLASFRVGNNIDRVDEGEAREE